MNSNAGRLLQQQIARQRQHVLDQWSAHLTHSTSVPTHLLTEAERAAICGELLDLFMDACGQGGLGSADSPTWQPAQAFLADLSSRQAIAGFTPSQTAMLVMSLKHPIEQLIDGMNNDQEVISSEDRWRVRSAIDQLGLHTADVFLQTRERLILRQREELLELSTPVVRLWKDILAVPLIGTLDSERTQVVMETLLEKIVHSEAQIAIIDITGVPTVDTLVAQHLLKTVAAARLMGADCIVSGISPQIAQTIVQLGVELGDVTTKATLEAAFRAALERLEMHALPGAEAVEK